MGHPDNIPDNQSEHFAKCELCSQYFDCRDLSAVFYHCHDEMQNPEYVSSRKVNDPIEMVAGKILVPLN